MNVSNGLSYWENLLISKHLVERCTNAANDISDWCQLAIKHRDEIQAIGIVNFDNWSDQRDDTTQLSSFHFEKLLILKERQRRELEDMIHYK